MPFSIQDFITPPAIRQVQVKLEPAHNAIYSLSLLSRSDELSGLSEWVTRTASHLSPQEKARHRLVMIGLHYAVVPLKSWSSFPEFLDNLAHAPAETVRDKLLDAYINLPCEDAPMPQNEQEIQSVLTTALQSPENYLKFLFERFDQNFVDKELERQAYEYVMNPHAMQELIINHLNAMWEKYLSKEWQDVQSMLLDSVVAFQQIDFTKMTKMEAARSITGHEYNEEKLEWNIASAEQVVFVPNAHTGPYLGFIHGGGTLWVLFGARLPKDVRFDAPDLSRAEILVRLNALADDSRLRILKHIARNGEISSQDIIQDLDLSQSTASRHLTQLSATGYLHERRCDGAKCYSLNREKLDETLQAISSYLQVEKPG
jgi:DNA-binding transcriptional ArsR family regulator